MNKDQVQGAVQDAAGKVQQTLGMATGNAERRLGGVTRELSGKGQHAYGDLRETVDDASDLYDRASRQIASGAHDAERRIEQNPFASLVIAATIGYLAGFLIHRRS